MVTFKVTVEDEKADALKKLLTEVPFVNAVEKEKTLDLPQQPETAYKRIKTLLKNAEGKNLFSDIEDPAQWQREIRKEWERDFR